MRSSWGASGRKANATRRALASSNVSDLDPTPLCARTLSILWRFFSSVSLLLCLRDFCCPVLDRSSPSSSSLPDRRESSSTDERVFWRVAKPWCPLGGRTLDVMPVDADSRCVREQVSAAARNP